MCKMIHYAGLIMFGLLPLATTQITDCGSTGNYYGTSGMIYSPNYPSHFVNSANCTYTWYVPTLSSVSLTFQYFDTEYSASNCGYDSVEVVIRFKSDGSVYGRGFAISYRTDPIECTGNCTPITKSYGYVCACDTNETTITMPTMNSNPQCKDGCTLQSDNSLLYCVCAVSGSTTEPDTYTTTRQCPYGCSITHDYYGYPTCSCTQSMTTSRPCPSGCYLATDWLGYPNCNCPSSTSSPLSCPYGCYNDADSWGNQYCNCPSSTQPPMRCSTDCVSDINIYGDRYCRCPTTTLPPCFCPCYYAWDNTYDDGFALVLQPLQVPKLPIGISVAILQTKVTSSSVRK